MFRHHPDQIIYINDLQIPLDFFKQLEPNYLLPAEILSKEYLPNKYHKLFNEFGQWPGEMPWIEGDRYIDKVEEYKKAWKAYQKSLEPTIIEQPILPNPKKTALDKLDKATTIAQLKTILTEYFKS